MKNLLLSPGAWAAKMQAEDLWSERKCAAQGKIYFSHRIRPLFKALAIYNKEERIIFQQARKSIQVK